uniref:Uncharacterized protein n=1 Tax=Chromera velia CCMP2878 TaxID=1169474 RepID=A0A0K6S9W7_9ALVE|eukprot:Cvel_31039.t1-p1 / transcript=Cvel_31039.t1 / gene=Cvel_31039 / organism=Chromera_velia_CCMP2878 / gene_product=hypothetical protein / transcript_product=hypothetical protein / location=Cvel_scaffold4546:836-7855(+) / protein_length=758 / sequence_SO=supercontig / SO=protein_coding / is_pseudo=false
MLVMQSRSIHSSFLAFRLAGSAPGSEWKEGEASELKETEGSVPRSEWKRSEASELKEREGQHPAVSKSLDAPYGYSVCVSRSNCSSFASLRRSSHPSDGLPFEGIPLRTFPDPHSLPFYPHGLLLTPRPFQTSNPCSIVLPAGPVLFSEWKQDEVSELKEKEGARVPMGSSKAEEVGCKAGPRCRAGARCGARLGCRAGEGCRAGVHCRAAEGCRAGVQCRAGERYRAGEECGAGEGCRARLGWARARAEIQRVDRTSTGSLQAHLWKGQSECKGVRVSLQQEDDTSAVLRNPRGPMSHSPPEGGGPPGRRHSEGAGGCWRGLEPAGHAQALGPGLEQLLGGRDGCDATELQNAHFHDAVRGGETFGEGVGTGVAAGSVDRLEKTFRQLNMGSKAFAALRKEAQAPSDACAYITASPALPGLEQRLAGSNGRELDPRSELENAHFRDGPGVRRGEPFAESVESAVEIGTVADWALSNKTKNRLAHAYYGNTQSTGNMPQWAQNEEDKEALELWGRVCALEAPPSVMQHRPSAETWLKEKEREREERQRERELEFARLQAGPASQPAQQCTAQGQEPLDEVKRLKDEIEKLKEDYQKLKEDKALSLYSLSAAGKALQNASTTRVKLDTFKKLGEPKLQMVCWKAPSLHLRRHIKKWLETNRELNTEGVCQWRNTQALHSYVVLYIVTDYPLAAVMEQSGLETSNLAVKTTEFEEPYNWSRGSPGACRVLFPKKEIETGGSNAADQENSEGGGDAMSSTT